MTDGSEKRINSRYPAEVALRYDFMYDIEANLEYQLKGLPVQGPMLPKYSAISKNVSLEGLGFFAPKLLSEGDLLNLELYLPHEKHPIHMEGKVCWSKPTEAQNLNSKLHFETGVKLIKVEGQAVSDTIYFDEEYKVLWSKVLDSILGGYRLSVLKEKEK